MPLRRVLLQAALSHAGRPSVPAPTCHAAPVPPSTPMETASDAVAAVHIPAAQHQLACHSQGAERCIITSRPYAALLRLVPLHAHDPHL